MDILLIINDSGLKIVLHVSEHVSILIDIHEYRIKLLYKKFPLYHQTIFQRECNKLHSHHQ